jgi:hypothetical protein
MFHDGPDQFVDPRQEEGGWQAATDEISPFHRPKSHRSSTEATKIDLFPNGVGSIKCSFFSSDVIKRQIRTFRFLSATLSGTPTKVPGDHRILARSSGKIGQKWRSTVSF